MIDIDLIIVTGRPSAWGYVFMNIMNIKAVICENGALLYYRHNDQIVKHYLTDYHPDGILEQIKSTFPELTISDDQNSREFDVAVVLDDKYYLHEIALLKFLDDHDLTYKISNIHINIYRGKYNKRDAVVEYMRINGILDQDLCAYIGDSPNDEPMFEYFNNSYGVHGVTKFKMHYPKFISEYEEYLGFLDIMDRIKGSNTE
jgi:HAD superfamily hydrolase (TIGR01484 family)